MAHIYGSYICIRFEEQCQPVLEGLMTERTVGIKDCPTASSATGIQYIHTYLLIYVIHIEYENRLANRFASNRHTISREHIFAHYIYLNIHTYIQAHQ